MLKNTIIKWKKYLQYLSLFHQDILKYTDKAGLDTKDLQRAVDVMHVVPKAANDMMNVGRLQGFDVSVIRLYYED